MKSFPLAWLLPLTIAISLGGYTGAPTAPAPSVIGAGQMPALCSDGKVVYIVYGLGDKLLLRPAANDRGSFGKPEVIATVRGLHASAMRGPQIVATEHGLCVVATTEAGDVYAFTQQAGGRWSGAVKITDRDSVDLEGFVALAGDGHMSLFAAWLDLRKTHQNKIYGARSLDGGKTWSKNIMVYTSPDTTVCQCCKPSAAMHGNSVYVMFRNWLHGNRDLYLIESIDQGRTFGAAKKMGTQSWQLNGCPMDGGALALNSNGVVSSVWNRRGTIYSCEPGEQEMPVGKGRGCTMTVVNGQKIYAWIEDKQVTLLTGRGIKKVLGTGQSPALQPVGNDAVMCVWENNKALQYELVRL